MDDIRAAHKTYNASDITTYTNNAQCSTYLLLATMHNMEYTIQLYNNTYKATSHNITQTSDNVAQRHTRSYDSI